MNKLSVFIIAKNEEKRIKYTLESIEGLAAEIILVDSGSTDKTIEIAKTYGAKIYDITWNGYVDAKIKGESFCSNNWVLNLDADESLTKELKDEIFSELEQPKNDAYYIDIVVLKQGEEKLRMFAPKNSAIRLYRKDKASFVGENKGLYYDRVSIANNCKTNLLKNKILHRTTISINQMIDKLNRYSDIQSEEMHNRKRKVSSIRLVFEPIIVFVKFYFFRRYFVFGIDGIVESYIFSFSKFLRLAKLRERYRFSNEKMI